MLPSVSQFSSGLSPRIRRSSHWLDTPCSLDTPNLDTPSLSSSPVSSGHLSPIHFAGVACIGVDCRHTRAMIDRSSPTPLGTRLSTTDSPACEISQPFDHVADDSNSSSKLTLVGSPARRSKPRPFDLSRTCAVEESDLKVYVPVECPPGRRYSEGYPATSIDVYRHISREHSASLYGHADNGNSMASLVEMVPRGQSGVRGEGREASPSHDTSPVLNTLFPDDENDPVSTGTTAPWRYQSTTDGIHKVPATRSSFDGSAFSRFVTTQQVKYILCRINIQFYNI